MNIKQQLNNSFFALFIGALLIGARDTTNFDGFGLLKGEYFFFLFFFKLKMYLDDNNNFKTGEMSSKRKDFVLGYITTMISWIFFPVAAYRVWDESLCVSIVFLIIAILFLSIWTISAAFFVEPKEPMHKKWFWWNVAYTTGLIVLVVLLHLAKKVCCCCAINLECGAGVILLGLIGFLFFDYKQSNTFENAKL